MDQHLSKRYAPWLWLLLGLFTLRVITQLLLTRFEFPFIPAFEQWHSAAMPYWLLLLSQIVILAVMVRVSLNFSRGSVASNRRLGVGLAVFGIIYLIIMLIRLLLGLTVFADSRWFTNWIPTFFHIVLACFVLLVATFHLIQLRE